MPAWADPKIKEFILKQIKNQGGQKNVKGTQAVSKTCI